MTHSGKFLTPRTPEEVFALLAIPQRFAPLLPHYESMSIEDATHFTVRIVIAVGQIRGRASLAMELCENVPHSRVEYRGQSIVAGSQLELAMRFHIAPAAGLTDVLWMGDAGFEGGVGFIAASLADTLGRESFDLMAQRLQNVLNGEPATPSMEMPATDTARPPDSRTKHSVRS
jgi:carbon monoxide dehydrogenase subunit G